MVNHIPFDGCFKDCFASTSLHLNLTDFEMPVDVGVRGLRDTQVILLESVVSLNDGGKFLGDLDITGCWKSRKLNIGHSHCPHDASTQPQEGCATADTSGVPEKLKSLASIDCWDEFFDFPLGKGIVRASGNWQGRIAATAASIQKRKKTLLLPRNACLKCLQDVDISKFDLVIA
jgi:hypothetical protein